jgi:hypothetical protein
VEFFKFMTNYLLPVEDIALKVLSSSSTINFLLSTIKENLKRFPQDRTYWLEVVKSESHQQDNRSPKMMGLMWYTAILIEPSKNLIKGFSVNKKGCSLNRAFDGNLLSNKDGVMKYDFEYTGSQVPLRLKRVGKGKLSFINKDHFTGQFVSPHWADIDFILTGYRISESDYARFSSPKTTDKERLEMIKRITHVA